MRDPAGGQNALSDAALVAGAQLESPKHRPVAVPLSYCVEMISIDFVRYFLQGSFCFEKLDCYLFADVVVPTRYKAIALNRSTSWLGNIDFALIRNCCCRFSSKSLTSIFDDWMKSKHVKRRRRYYFVESTHWLLKHRSFSEVATEFATHCEFGVWQMPAASQRPIDCFVC